MLQGKGARGGDREKKRRARVKIEGVIIITKVPGRKLHRE